MSQHSPAVDNWYKLADGETFRVTAIDEDEQYVEIQYLDGSVESLEINTWNRLGVSDIEPDEEWLDELEANVEELDFMNLGVAPGTEGIEHYNDISTLYQDSE